MAAPGYNPARFDFVSIRLAVTCAQTGSLTSAARDCNLVLPAASRRTRELESRARFVKTGNPNGGTLPAWPRHDAARQQYLEFGKEIHPAAFGPQA
ncbi:MAG: LysR family transcriptional regulator, partial [Variovorax sp.]